MLYSKRKGMFPRQKNLLLPKEGNKRVTFRYENIFEENFVKKGKHKIEVAKI